MGTVSEATLTKWLSLTVCQDFLNVLGMCQNSTKNPSCQGGEKREVVTTVTGLSGPQFPYFQNGVGSLWEGSLTSLDVHHFTRCVPCSPLGILLMKP